MQFCKVVQQRRIFGLFFAGYRIHNRFPGSHIRNQFFCTFTLQKAILFIQKGRLEVFAAFHASPLRIERMPGQLQILQYTIKRGFYKPPDFSFTIHHNSKDAGHNTAHRNHCFIPSQESFYRITVFQGKHP